MMGRTLKNPKKSKTIVGIGPNAKKYLGRNKSPSAYKNSPIVAQPGLLEGVKETLEQIVEQTKKAKTLFTVPDEVKPKNDTDIRPDDAERGLNYLIAEITKKLDFSHLMDKFGIPAPTTKDMPWLDKAPKNVYKNRVDNKYKDQIDEIDK